MVLIFPSYTLEHWTQFMLIFILHLITGHNKVVAKVIFLHLSVIHSVHRGEGVCLSACWDTTPPRADPPGADTPLDQTPHPLTRHPPRADPQEQTPPQKADSSIWSMSGQYASYWNAFLFVMWLQIFRMLIIQQAMFKFHSAIALKFLERVHYINQGCWWTSPCLCVFLNYVEIPSRFLIDWYYTAKLLPSSKKSNYLTSFSFGLLALVHKYHCCSFLAFRT